MKIFTLLVALLFTTVSMNAQFSKNGFSYKLIVVDYETPLMDKYNANIYKMDRGIDFSYNRTLTSALDLVVPFRVGTTTLAGTESDGFVKDNELFLGLDATLKFNFANDFILPKTSFIRPYVTGGAGITAFPAFDNKTVVNLPLGVGIDFALNDNLMFQTQAEYRFLDVESYVYSAGLKLIFGEAAAEKIIIEEELPIKIDVADTDGDGNDDNKDACPKIAGLAKFGGCPDTDNDGVMDSKDKCPKVKGLLAFNGCPDTDGDGVMDSADKCPKVKGLASLGGCPDGDSDNDGVSNLADKCPNIAGTAALGGCPDTDNDGVMDSADKCPKVKGLAQYGGCPDTDGDGVSDNFDKCPTVAGSASAAGCPIIKKEEVARLNFATKSIQFETGKNIIKKSSYTIMNEVAAILNKYPNYNVAIEGYTDNVGNDASNQRLSESRAKVCYEYLISKGIQASNMSYKGYGETNPIADNTTAAGRQMNRRVELKLTQK
jgi:outer membrane protein OmpA-like peptidoglycan-associated protein